METKICTKCKIKQPITQFPPSKYSSQKIGAISKGRNSWCHTCILSQKKNYYLRNYAKIQERIVKWRLKNKERYAGYMKKRYEKDKNSGEYHNKKFQKLYKISLADYNRLIKLQNGVCAICKTNVSSKHKKLFIDHCHETGIIRGLLCGNCNMAIGLIYDSSAIARRLADYLDFAYNIPSWEERLSKRKD